MRVLVCFFMLLPLLTWSQERLVTFEEVKFESSAERDILKRVWDEKAVSVESFLAIAYDDTAKYLKWITYFEEQIAPLRARKIKKNKRKDLNLIYRQLHDDFLTKYEYVAYFDQIFETGVYNCVTAVALYALTFDELGVNYSIKETPTHVYMVAEPETEQLLIETTDPLNGFTTFSRTFKESYVSQLVDRKLVDRSDLREGVNAVFDEHYLGSDNITAVELLGLQYYNLGLQHYDEKEFYKAWKLLSKAQLFYAAEQVYTMLFSSLINHLAMSDYTEPKDFELLFMLPRFTGYSLKKSEIAAEYGRMMHNVLITRGDEQLSDSLFAMFNEGTNDEEILAEVSFYHYYERSRLLHDRARYRASFEFARKAYDVKPENAEVEKLLVWSVAKANFDGGNEEASAIVDTLLQDFPDLANNNHFLGFRCNLMLDRMSAAYTAGQPTKGAELKAAFESGITAYPDAVYNQYKVGDAYSEAAVYHFRRNRLQTARQILNEGLQYAPGNMELKNRLYMINR